MNVYVRKETSEGVAFEIEKGVDSTLQQFYRKYVPGIFYFDLINFHLMLCVDLEKRVVLEVCTDLSKRTVENFVDEYENKSLARMASSGLFVSLA